jgi:hypothetical protein
LLKPIVLMAKYLGFEEGVSHTEGHCEMWAKKGSSTVAQQTGHQKISPAKAFLPEIGYDVADASSAAVGILC